MCWTSTPTPRSWAASSTATTTPAILPASACCLRKSANGTPASTTKTAAFEEGTKVLPGKACSGRWASPTSSQSSARCWALSRRTIASLSSRFQTTCKWGEPSFRLFSTSRHREDPSPTILTRDRTSVTLSLREAIAALVRTNSRKCINYSNPNRK